MPKDRSKRTVIHNSSVKLAKRQFAVQDNAVERVEIGAAKDVSANELLQSTDSSDPGANLKKKDKQQLKREAFLQRLELTQNPYSKSHQRRMKRKAREQIGQGLDDIHAALKSLDKDDHSAQEGEEASKVRTATKVKPGQIGEGKATTLSSAQRKRALEVERLRHPLILSNPQFKLNPFQTIRTHAQNTLVKHVPT